MQKYAIDDAGRGKPWELLLNVDGEFSKEMRLGRSISIARLLCLQKRRYCSVLYTVRLEASGDVQHSFITRSACHYSDNRLFGSVAVSQGPVLPRHPS